MGKMNYRFETNCNLQHTYPFLWSSSQEGKTKHKMAVCI